MLSSQSSSDRGAVFGSRRLQLALLNETSGSELGSQRIISSSGAGICLPQKTLHVRPDRSGYTRSPTLATRERTHAVAAQTLQLAPLITMDDEEQQPLLSGGQTEPQSFSERISTALKEPSALNGLEKGLAALVVFFLLLTATGFGLFAGESVKLGHEVGASVLRGRAESDRSSSGPTCRGSTGRAGSPRPPSLPPRRAPSQAQQPPPPRSPRSRARTCVRLPTTHGAELIRRAGRGLPHFHLRHGRQLRHLCARHDRRPMRRLLPLCECV